MDGIERIGSAGDAQVLARRLLAPERTRPVVVLTVPGAQTAAAATSGPPVCCPSENSTMVADGQ